MPEPDSLITILAEMIVKEIQSNLKFGNEKNNLHLVSIPLFRGTAVS